MGNCAFGWNNRVTTGAVSASAEVAGLTASQVQNNHGATSTSWQTPVGTTSAWLQVDAGAAVSWGAISLHNTNLTAAATVRFRLANDTAAFGSATALSVDSNDGCTLGANTTRVGTVTDPDGGSAAVEYDSTSVGASFVSVDATQPVVAGNTYRVRVWARRVAVGATLQGLLIRVVHPNGTVSSLDAVGNVTDSWQQFTLDFTPATSGSVSIAWFHSVTNGTGTMAFYQGAIEPLTAYDSGDLSALVVAGYRQAVHVLASTVTARYLRADIADATNPENVLRVAQMFAGPISRPARNFGFSSTFGRAATTPAPVTRGGQEFPELHFVRRAWQIAMPVLAPEDVWPFAQEMQRATDAGGNLLFVPFPEGADIAREAVFGRLVAPAAIGWPGNTPRARTWSATITERL